MNSQEPYAKVGAGPLVSTLWKTRDEQGEWRYCFNIFREDARSGEVSQLLGPADIQDLVRLSQVLAAVLADDGCVSADQRRVLNTLVAKLDCLTRERI